MKTGAPFVHVPYRSGAQAVTDVIGGTVPMTIYQVTAVLPFVKEGRLKALATTSAKRLEMVPEVPTAIEQAAMAEPLVYINAGQRGLLLSLPPEQARDVLHARCGPVVA